MPWSSTQWSPGYYRFGFKGAYMDKFGVEIPEDGQTKHSSAGECSQCGGKLDMNSNPPMCRACGTEPQEEAPKEKK